VADRETVKRFFRPLRESALPPEQNLEARGKDEVQDALERATAGCPRDRRYLKGRRSFQVVAELDPDTLAKHLPHFDRFIQAMRAAGG
jgi:hypothetical protein